MRHDGRTQFKRRLLAANGWRVVEIDYKDWMEVRKQGRLQQVDFLREAMRRVL